MRPCFTYSDILLPRDDEAAMLWPVVACDQFTSQREYWEDVARLTEGKPTALNIVFPEVYLEEGFERIDSIKRHMEEYLAPSGVLTERVKKGFVLVERSTQSGVRLGLVGQVDLEQYDFSPESPALIKATEGTVRERIPPRVRIREGALIESPHVMLLIDDYQRRLIEPLYEKRAQLPLLYDLELMKNGGHLRGYAVEGQEAQRVQELINELQSASSGLFLAVGDGNHSLATAKACWERIKPQLSGDELDSHPARFSLAELVNLHCEALNFEPIHRVLFNVDMAELVEGFTSTVATEPGEDVVFISGGKREAVRLSQAGDRLPVDLVQEYLDKYLPDHPQARIDYVHGEAAVRELSAPEDNCGILLPAMDKRSLFPAIVAGGVLPRKTFSMGEAEEKRYYMECRRIR